MRPAVWGDDLVVVLQLDAKGGVGEQFRHDHREIPAVLPSPFDVQRCRLAAILPGGTPKIGAEPSGISLGRQLVEHASG